jgi:glutaminyl-peptide cyclotransferase
MPSYFKTTHWAYKNMATLEQRFRQQKSFKSSPNHESKAPAGLNPKSPGPVRQSREPIWLNDANKNPNAGNFMGGMVQDDHLPFMARGVEILHLIPSPFPAVWHTPQDDGPHLDLDTCEDWAKLTTAFAAEWMDLEGFMTPSGGNGKPAQPAQPAQPAVLEEKDGLDVKQVLDRRKEDDEVPISKTEL